MCDISEMNPRLYYEVSRDHVQKWRTNSLAQCWVVRMIRHRIRNRVMLVLIHNICKLGSLLLLKHLLRLLSPTLRLWKLSQFPHVLILYYFLDTTESRQICHCHHALLILIHIDREISLALILKVFMCFHSLIKSLETSHLISFIYLFIKMIEQILLLLLSKMLQLKEKLLVFLCL